MPTYVILKDSNSPLRRRWVVGPRSFGGGPPQHAITSISDAMPPEPDVVVENLEPTDLREMERDPDVLDLARAMPTRLIAPVPLDDGEAPGSNWGVACVGADRSAADGRGVLVCVLDTGIDATHTAFRGVNLMEKDFTGTGNGDRNGHGTHCAGTLFGRDVDGIRIGVARGVTDALVGKVLPDSDEQGTSEMLFKGMQWASENDAKVISMSIGFDFPGFSRTLVHDHQFPVDLATSIALEAYRANLRLFDNLMDLIASKAAFNGGTVVVAASGNESKRNIHPHYEVGASVPSAAKGIVSVGALSETSNGLSVAAFSNTNPIVSAPGVNVISASTGGGLVPKSGTSMACPHAAGVAALWWQDLIERATVPITGSSVINRLRTACRTDVFLPGVDVLDRGDGLVQAPAMTGS